MSVAAWALAGLLGGLGAVARALLDGAVTRRAGAGLPWGTLAVNVLGCLLLGLLVGAGLGGEDGVVLAGGAVGALTTFSSWMAGTSRLLDDGRLAAAAGNVVVSLAAGASALEVGMWLEGLW